MPTLIESLAQALQKTATPGLRVQHHATEMLVSMATTKSRSQTVKVSLTKNVRGDIPLLRMISRAFIANDHRWIRFALEANAGPELGSLALDTSVVPPVVNVVYNIPATGVELPEFMAALTSVARYADQLEQRFLSNDRF